MKYAATVIKMLILVVLVLLSVFNLKTVDVTLIPGFVKQLPLFLLPLGGILLGFVLAALFYYIERMKLQRELKLLKGQLTGARDELKRIQNLPLMNDEDKKA